MQSWVRGSNKIKKEKDNRKIQWRINIEIINRIMYVIATVTLIILMGRLSFITAYSHNDLVISIMSAFDVSIIHFFECKKAQSIYGFCGYDICYNIWNNRSYSCFERKNFSHR